MSFDTHRASGISWSLEGQPIVDEQKLGSLEIQFNTPNGRPIPASELGEAFVTAQPSKGPPEEAAVVKVEPQESKTGNMYYAWDLNGNSLPDGFATQLVVNGTPLKAGVVSESKTGNQMRQDEGEISITGIVYKASGLIVRTRRPYWVKVVAHKKPGRGRRSR